jgi:hypothetical protein
MIFFNGGDMKQAVIGFVIILYGGFCSADTLLVPSEYSTIQAAIDDCNHGDEVIVAAGTYVENITFDGKQIVVRSEDPGDWDTVVNTVIDGSNGDPDEYGSCVTFRNSEDSNSILSGFTLTGGVGTRSHVYVTDERLPPGRLGDKDPIGGGIVCYYSSPVIERC